jgi:hypothetical protein
MYVYLNISWNVLEAAVQQAQPRTLLPPPPTSQNERRVTMEGSLASRWWGARLDFEPHSFDC